MPAAAGAVLAAGYVSGTATFGVQVLDAKGAGDGFLALWDESTGFQWAMLVGGGGDDAVGRLALTSDGFVAGGSFTQPGSPVDFGTGQPVVNKGASDGFVVRYQW